MVPAVAKVDGFDTNMLMRRICQVSNHLAVLLALWEIQDGTLGHDVLHQGYSSTASKAHESIESLLECNNKLLFNVVLCL